MGCNILLDFQAHRSTRCGHAHFPAKMARKIKISKKKVLYPWYHITNLFMQNFSQLAHKVPFGSTIISKKWFWKFKAWHPPQEWVTSIYTDNNMDTYFLWRVLGVFVGLWRGHSKVMCSISKQYVDISEDCAQGL